MMALVGRLVWALLLGSATVAAQSSGQGDLTAQGASKLQQDAEGARKGAEQGDAKQQAALAFYYQFGLGVKKDNAEAANWYHRAVEQGYTPALYQLFGMCRNHSTTARECAYVLESLRPLAENGNPVAQYDLGRLLEEGLGLPQDFGPSRNYSEAATYYRKSAEQGNWEAQMSLGQLYENGRGVPQDFVLAHMWLNLAAAAGPTLMQEGLAKEREAVASLMTQDQIAEAQRLAREWKPTIAPQR